MRTVTLRRLAGVLSVQALISLPGGSLGAQTVPAEELAQLHFRTIGPVGNRISSVTGVTGDPLTYYAGAASGGIWKSEDGGTIWRPLFDDQDSHSIGALAVAPSDPMVVWAGTGEPHIRSNVSLGDGVYRSTDGGETWANMGLEATGRISRVVIHPTNPDVVYVAALGHAHGPQPERGIYRSTDGGESWQHVLFVDENTGASDLVMDPANPRTLFAGMWQVVVNPWGRESGGPGSGVFMSRDAGDTWVRLEGHGLPELPIGKVGLCMTPRDPERIYALLETGDGVPWHGQETESGELWRSDDEGQTWRVMTYSRDFGGRTAYYNRCAVAPDDPDEAYFLTASFIRTIDGGRTGVSEGGLRRPGGDNHDMWIDPTDADRMIVANDGGLAISVNRGATWNRVQLPVAQMYHVTVDHDVPYHVMGNRQDGPSARGPSNSLFGSIPRGEWHSVGGGESGFATPDPVDPNVIWSSASGSGARGGIVVRYDERTRQFRNVEVWPESTGGWPAEGLRYRFQWTFPLLISPHDHQTIYVTSQVVHRTRNGGQSWDVISPDLTTNNRARQGISGGLTPDNIGVEYCCVIYAFDESPAQEGVFYAGSNDGRVHVSRDDGATWADVSARLPGSPPDGVVRGIDASRWSAGKAYLVIEAHQVGDFTTYAYRTEDFGESWTPITDGVPPGPLSFTRSILEDPVRPGLLYMGTENRLYVSFDDGDHWQALVNDLPPAPMYGLAVQEHFNDLVIATYGRGFWILDDVTPLQQLTADVLASSVHLFDPRAAYRFQGRTSPMSMPNDMTVGEDPPYGASLDYWLAEDVGGRVTLRVKDADGTVLRTLTGPGEKGLNRVWWDLEMERTTPIRMRTTPLYAPWVNLGPRRMRTAGGSIGVRVPPGRYVVSLEVGGEMYSKELEVLKDPHSEGSLADIEEQTAVLLSLREAFNEAAAAVNRIEWLRRQIEDMEAVLQDQGGADDVLEAAATLEASLIEVEEGLIQLRTTGTGQDGVRWPARILGRLRHLAGGVGTADFRPTDQQREVQAVLQGRLSNAREALAGVIEGEVAAFNRLLAERGMAPLISEEG